MLLRHLCGGVKSIPLEELLAPPFRAPPAGVQRRAPALSRSGAAARRPGAVGKNKKKKGFSGGPEPHFLCFDLKMRGIPSRGPRGGGDVTVEHAGWALNCSNPGRSFCSADL